MAAAVRPLRLIGHAANWNAVLDARDRDRLHHAWLLCGPAGIGKTLFAFEIAALLLGGTGAAERSAILDRPRDAAHPDLVSVARALDDRGKQRAELRVDEVRPVAAFLRRTAAEAGWRVVVVEEADRLNRNAANALLKVVEEPPPRCLLMLTCEAPGRLLPTLRSRCRQLPFRVPDTADALAVLRRSLPDRSETDHRALLELVDGAPGRAIALAGDEAGGLRRLAAELVAAPPPVARRDAAAETVLRAPNGVPVFLGMLADAISERVRADARRGVAVPEAILDGFEALRRLRHEAERFALEPRQALLSGLALLPPGPAA